MSVAVVCGSLFFWSSCKKNKQRCIDPLAINYDPNATGDDGTCVYSSDKILGCTNPLSDNFNPEATDDDGSCIISGCTDPNAENYNPDANNSTGNCIDKRLKWAGDWSVDNGCSVFLVFSLSTSQTISFDTLSGLANNTVFINPIIQLTGVTATGYVNDNTITIPDQNYGISGTFSGTGTLSTSPDTTITILYTYDDGIFTSGDCTAVYTKN